MTSGGTKLLVIGIAAIVAYSQFGGLGVMLVGVALFLMAK